MKSLQLLRQETTKYVLGKVINIFLLTNKKRWKLNIFWKQAFDNYPHMCEGFISKH